MQQVGQQDEDPARGEALVAELRWVHNLIRRDLRTVRQLAYQLADGLAGPDAARAIETLEVGGPLWQLKVNCLRYCRFVHSHHHAESAMLFPQLRLASPALGPVVDKLESDHVRVSGLLDDVSSAARELAAREDTAVRQRLVDALDVLSTDLLAHLDYEEEHISGTLRSWSSWPWW